MFFDDYANTVVVGSAVRPLTDSHRISREKLAYIAKHLDGLKLFLDDGSVESDRPANPPYRD